MAVDRDAQKEIDRRWNRTLDFDKTLIYGQSGQAISAVTDTDVRGVDNGHVMLSAGIYFQVTRINGVPFKVALTSAFG